MHALAYDFVLPLRRLKGYTCCRVGMDGISCLCQDFLYLSQLPLSMPLLFNYIWVLFVAPTNLKSTLVKAYSAS